MDGQKLEEKNSSGFAIRGLKNYYAEQLSKLISFLCHLKLLCLGNIFVCNEAMVLSFTSIEVICTLTLYISQRVFGMIYMWQSLQSGWTFSTMNKEQEQRRYLYMFHHSWRHQSNQMHKSRSAALQHSETVNYGPYNQWWYRIIY